MDNDSPTLLPIHRIQGAVWGLLIGDALGVPYEFAPASRIPHVSKIEFCPPVEFIRAHWGVPPGTWSDDGAQALCLLSSLLDNKCLDPLDLMQRISQWYSHGLFAVKGDVFDVGDQTRHAVEAFLRSGGKTLTPAKADAFSNGNGSLMRVLPLALWHKGTHRDLVRDAIGQSYITHGHVRAALACAFYCLWARSIAADAKDPWREATIELEAQFPSGSVEREEIDNHLDLHSPPHGKGTGYVVDALHSARMVLQAGSYESVVRAAIALGHDTDTTACIAGGLAGLRDGLHAIPKRWRKDLRGQEIALPLIARLIEHLSP